MRTSFIVFLILITIFSCLLLPSTFAGELIYSTFIGGSNEDYGYNLAIDTFGNAYITGYTRSPDFPVTAGAYDTSTNGDADVYVTKLNTTGTALVYSTILGGTNYEEALGIAVDLLGNVYITGNTYSSNFPTTAGAFQTAYHGYQDGFVTRLNSTGSALFYSTYLGGSDGTDSGQIIVIDTLGNAYITGYTSSSDFPTTTNAFDISYNSGVNDAFVSKLNATGTALVYSTYLGGTNTDYGRSIAIDAEGNAYILGDTDSADFPTTAGAFDTSYHAGYDATISKLNPSGTALIYSTYLGGEYHEYLEDIAVDNLGHAYVTGSTLSPDFPTTLGAFDTSYNTSGDAFVTKVDPTGTGLVYSTFLGGYGYDAGLSIAVNHSGIVYLTGQTVSPNFPVTTGAFDTSFN